MSPIPDIRIREFDIPRTTIWSPRIDPIPDIHPPVTLEVGFPVVYMPGCVEAHRDNEKQGQPWDRNLVEDDQGGAYTGAGTLCPDGSLPYFYPMNFEPDRDLDTIVAKRGEPPPPPAAGTPDTSKVVDKPIECPGPNSPRIGDVAQNKTERVSGFELSDDGKICIVLYEDIPFTAQYLPAPQVVATTGGIAVVATTSALLAKPLAELLLKVVKPVVKKAIGKVQKMLGQTPYRPTQSELKTNLYREKKGLLAIPFAKNHQKRMKAQKKKEEEEKKS